MKIKLFIIDVDGTLTDSSIYYGDNNIEIKAFSAKDGAVLKHLPKVGINSIFLTGRESEAVNRRAAELGVDVVQNISDKKTSLQELLSERGVLLENTAYIGDDLNDYAAMKICGFKACPADAADEIKSICDYISPNNGGHDAVRDIIEHILKRHGQWNDFWGLMT